MFIKKIIIKNSNLNFSFKFKKIKFLYKNTKIHSKIWHFK